MHAKIGDRVVVETERASQTARHGVIEEILQDKIYLDISGEVRTRGGDVPDVSRAGMFMDTSSAGED